MDSSSWTSLEIVKLIVSTLTPIAVVGVGYAVARATKHLDSVQWANQTVIKRRLEIFDELAPKLNRLLCFALFVGSWKETPPARAITLKREIDETMHVYRVLFSPRVFHAYLDYMETIFLTFARPDQDALVRAQIACPLGDRRNLPWWQADMETCFVASDPPTPARVRETHDALASAFRHDLYVTRHELALPES